MDSDSEKRSLEDIFGKTPSRMRRLTTDVRQRRSVRQVRETSDANEARITVHERAKTFTRQASSTGFQKKLFLLFVALVALFAIGLILTKTFGTATVVITPTNITVPVTLQSIVSKEISDASTLVFETVTKKIEKSTVVPATGTEYRETKASGTVKIFNSSGALQKLSAETRFEGSNGKIYKTGPRDAVTIPGGTTKNPGIREVTLYASEPGESFNAETLDFNILGFKGTPKYTLIIARSVTAFTGGGKGNVPVISDSIRKNAEAQLTSEAHAQSLQAVQEQIPDDFVALPGAVWQGKQVFRLANTESGNQLLLTREDTYLLLRKESLQKYLAEKLLPELAVGDTSLAMRSFDTLRIAIAPQTTEQTSRVPITFSGTATFEWVVPTEKLVQEIADYPRKTVASVFASYPSIGKAFVYLKPVWLMRLPADPEKIKLETVSE